MRQHLYHVKLVPSPLGGNLWGAFAVMNPSPNRETSRLGRKPIILAKHLDNVMNRIRDRLADRNGIVDEAAEMIAQSIAPDDDEYPEWYRDYRFGQ